MLCFSGTFLSCRRSCGFRAHVATRRREPDAAARLFVRLTEESGKLQEFHSTMSGSGSLSEKMTHELGTQSIFRLLLRFSIPSLLSNLMFTVYNVVDRIFISWKLGTDAIAGVGITFYLFMIFIAVGMMFGIGGGTLISLKLGEKNKEAAERILGNVIMIFLIGGALTTLLGFTFLKPLLYCFGASEATYPYAAEYFRILLWFMAADFLSMGTTNLIRAEGSPNFSMFFIAVGCFANIALDWVFIMQWDWGIAGAAWATGISKLLSTILMFWHFSVGPFRYLTLRWRNLRIDWKYFTAMTAIGISPLILQSINSVLNALINTTLLRNGGDKAVASMTCISTIIMLLMIPTFGVMMGYQPIVGYNYGARQFRRVAQTLKGAFLMSGGATLLFYVPVMIWASTIVGWFCNNDSEVVPMAAHGLRIFFLLFPLWPIFCIGSNFFQSTGRPKMTIFLTVFRNGFCFLGCIIVLPILFGLNGVWATAPAADGMAALVIAYLLHREFRKLHRLEELASVESVRSGAQRISAPVAG